MRYFGWSLLQRAAYRGKARAFQMMFEKLGDAQKAIVLGKVGDSEGKTAYHENSPTKCDLATTLIQGWLHDDQAAVQLPSVRKIMTTMLAAGSDSFADCVEWLAGRTRTKVSEKYFFRLYSNFMKTCYFATQKSLVFVNFEIIDVLYLL